MKERIIKACEAAGLRGYEIDEIDGWWAMRICGRRVDVSDGGRAFVGGDIGRSYSIAGAVSQTRAFLEMVHRGTARRVEDTMKLGADAGRAIGIVE